MMQNFKEMPNVKAEMWLNYIYPDMNSRWVVRSSGAFLRNYSEDIIAIDNDSSSLGLSRNGFIQLLPSGLISSDIVGNAEQVKADNMKLKVLGDIFSPLDTLNFRRSLGVESIVADLTDNKLSYILKTFFDFDYDMESNPYVKRASVLLPTISKIRGDLGFVQDLLAALLDCKVDIKTGQYRTNERSDYMLPKVTYTMKIYDLTHKEYIELESELEPLYAMLREWFIPFDIESLFVIEHHRDSVALTDDSTLLGYNAFLK